MPSGAAARTCTRAAAASFARRPCSLLLRFDDAAASRWKAPLPEPGEPAIFIDDDAALAAKLPGTRRLAIEATLRDQGPVTLLFEPGDFEPGRWVELPSK